MNDSIQPYSQTVSSRPPPSTTRVDRIRVRENEKLARHLQLMSLKTSVLPLVFPTLTRPRDAKCGNCDVEKQKYTKLEDWFTEPLDALMTPFPSNQGWKERLQMWLLHRQLAGSMDSLAVHPSHIKMIQNIEENAKKPVVLVVQSENPELDFLLIHFVLRLFDVKRPLTLFNGKSVEFTMSREFRLENAKEISESKVATHLCSSGNVLMLLHDNTSNSSDLATVLGACGLGSNFEIFLLPVSISSEKPREALGKSKKRAGIVKMNFHEPYTVGDLTQVRSEFLDEDAKVKIVADHIETDIALKRPIMSTNVVAFQMLTQFRNGTTLGALAGSLQELQENLKDVDFGFEGDAQDVVEHAVDLLNGLLIAEGDVVKLNNSTIVQLTEFAKPLLPHFALESILVVSALSLRSSEGYVDFNTLLSTGSELCEVLHSMISLKRPCEDFNSVLDKAFDRCSLQSVMRKPLAEVVTDNQQRALRMARYLESDEEYSDDDDGYQSRNPENEVTMNDAMKEKIEWLKNVTLPILDAYLTVFYTFKAHKRGEQVSKKIFLEKSLRSMSEELEDGNCKYWESCSPLWMENCIDYLAAKGVIEAKGGMLNYSNKTPIKDVISKLQRFFP